jgi:flagellin-like hook-associated protein FlgL
MQQAESTIRDVDIGAAMVQFTRDQVLTQFQTRIVAGSDRIAQTVATLVSDSIVR